jgi:phosphatidylglycerophosphate synthase
MKEPLPALLILADSPDALTDLCGISLLERLGRIVRKLGFGEAMILSNAVESMAIHAGKSSWHRGEVALKFRERKTQEVTIGEVLDCIGAMTLPPDGRVLIVSAGFYCDERLLRVLAEAKTESALIDSDPPSFTRSFWEDSDIDGFDRLSCALLLSREWLIGKDHAVSFGQEVAAEAVSGRIASLDAAQQPSYVRSMRRNVRPVFFPAASPEHRALAERLLQDATQNGTLDIPALAHAPIETWLVSQLWKTSIRPNQITFVTMLVGLSVTLFYATGHLWSGTVLAWIVGILDGLDGKLARIKVETTELGEWEHTLDYVVELSWWTALAHHFYATDQIPNAYLMLILLLGSDLMDRLARRSVKKRLGRSLDDVTSFDRIVRGVGGRRNTYIWIFTVGLALGAAANAFVALCWWGAATAAAHVIRALQIRFGRPVALP